MQGRMLFVGSLENLSATLYGYMNVFVTVLTLCKSLACYVHYRTSLVPSPSQLFNVSRRKAGDEAIIGQYWISYSYIHHVLSLR